MMDHMLPIPAPDWDSPQPYDGPSYEETQAFRELQAVADGIRSWVTNAYLHRPGPDGWTALAQRLTTVADTCTRLGEDQQRTITGDVKE